MDKARARVAAIGMLATSAIVAAQAIQDASSADTDSPPPTSGIPRSTSWEEMLDPSWASAMMPMVLIATGRGGGPGGAGGLDDRVVLDEAMQRPSAEQAVDADRAGAVDDHQNEAADDGQMLEAGRHPLLPLRARRVTGKVPEQR